MEICKRDTANLLRTVSKSAIMFSVSEPNVSHTNSNSRSISFSPTCLLCPGLLSKAPHFVQ